MSSWPASARKSRRIASAGARRWIAPEIATHRRDVDPPSDRMDPQIIVERVRLTLLSAPAWRNPVPELHRQSCLEHAWVSAYQSFDIQRVRSSATNATKAAAEANDSATIKRGCV